MSLFIKKNQTSRLKQLTPAVSKLTFWEALFMDTIRTTQNKGVDKCPYYQGVLIKQVNFKENLWGETKKTAPCTENIMLSFLLLLWMFSFFLHSSASITAKES